MKHACKPVVGVDRRQYPDFVSASPELLCQLLDMGKDTTWVRVGIGADQTYAHNEKAS
jgi:hypothetical protein